MSLNCRCKCQREFLILFLLFIWHSPSSYGKGFFPNLVDLAVLKPVSSSSTCGATSSKYCQSSTRQSSLQTCEEKTCKFDCCANCGSSKPVAGDLAQYSTKSGVTQDGDPRNGSSINSFRFQGNAYIQPQRIPGVNYINPGFTVSVWIKQKARNRGTIISKDENIAPNFANVFQLVIQDYNLMFYYRPVSGNASVTTYTLLQSQSEKLKAEEWHLITVSVIDKGLSYYIDGELMNANNATLTGPIDDKGGTVRIGQKYGGDDQYEGLMQDILMYPTALTNREAIEAFTGTLPSAYVASNCRCPPTHPKINVAEPAKCLRNQEGNLDDTVSRLADTAHPIELATDGDTLSFWLSEITENATVDINLSYSGLQVFYVILTFYGPLPGALVIERSTDAGKTFQPWQYFAEDCVSSFMLPNNGPLTQPDSVNCIQYIKPLQSSREALTFQTEYPPPAGSNIPLRPFGQGCNHLYCSEKLLQFLKASHIKLHFFNHTLVQNPQHRYYGLYRILVTGRCECFGHASSFQYVEGSGGQIGRCVCNCHSSTNTEGENCNRCKPLYNNKPFLRGNRDEAYPCVKCECNDHADSCVYNQTLDTNPSSRTLGGGGVCTDCQHNTTGRFCEVCKKGFYRESGKSLKARDVCSPCGCEGPGVQPGKLDCIKDNSNSSVLAGQCACKANTFGRQCDKCKEGFFDLKGSHAAGCISCGCVLDGTKNRNSSCHAIMGQCDCKDRVTGTKCNTCKSGYWGLSGQDPLGCKACNCDPFGTIAGNVNTCNSVTGQCSCKQGVIGRRCDQCAEGFHSLTPNGCTSCNCSVAGTPPSLLDKCNKTSGMCSCKLYVEGNNCDRCKPGFYNLSQSNPQGCLQCACDSKGTVGGSGQCEQQSGNCTCKPLVIGQRCNQCKLGTFGLNQSDPNGCRPCNCFPKGTIDGDKKRPDELQCSGSNGQCPCLSNVEGLRCDSCVATYYWNPVGQGCVQCQCNAVGSVGSNCNDTGHCTCKANIGGRRCDQCVAGYYGFITTGRCTACNCNAAGSLLNQCDESGKCTCKQNVEGLKCDQCKNGTVNLQQNNKYGCSGAPSEQPAPFATVLSPRAIRLTWSPPDNPNGIILRYELYRNGTQIYSGLNQTFNDNSLTPDTVYYYYIITYTASGSTRSLDDGKMYRTFQDAPSGISPPVITNILPRNATATWQPPSMPNGRIIEYRLISNSSTGETEVVHCRGIIFTCSLGGLRPYTEYDFAVEACTNGGCSRSNVKTILTLPTLPDFQPAPNVTSLPGGRAVEVEWDEPPEPNGRIFRYELWMRGASFVGDGALKYNSNPAHDSNPLNFRRTNVTGLQPFTEYEFRVRTFTAQVRGDRASAWTRHRTGEGTPMGQNAMNTGASPFNSSAVVVSWSPPQTPQGNISRYVIYKYQPPSNTTAVRATEVAGSQRQGVVVELKPYTEYKFTVRACNSFDCSGHSPAAFTRTHPAAPEGQGPPQVYSVDSSTVYLKWSQPQTPNGPLPPTYNVSRAFSALHYPPPLVAAGVHFPGLGYYKFPSGFVRTGATNNIELWFRTQYAFGLILFLVSDGSQTDMLAVEMRDGKPWLIFDCQDGAAAFTISQSVRFDDNQWHHMKITRRSRNGTLIVDGYSASQNSPGSATVISANTGVYVGGLPSAFTILRRDTGNSKILRINFIGCLRGVTSEESALPSKRLDWTSAPEAVGVEPQRNGCPARDNRKAVFLRGGGYVAINRQTSDLLLTNIFTFKLNFRTQLSSGILLFAYGPTTTFAIQFTRNRVEMKYSSSSAQGSLSISPPSGEICDGKWHNLTVTNFQGTFTVVLDNKKSPDEPVIANFQIQSSVYVGGIPWGSEADKVARQAGVDVEALFGGCIKVFSTLLEINYPRDVTAMHNADLDGCRPESTEPVSSQMGSCLPFNSSVVHSGKTEMFNDSTVETFTDYLYRVESYHAGTAGSSKSAWIATRSGQGAPTGLQAPIQLISLPGGTTVRVAWVPPQRPNGVLTEYRILSYRVLPPQAVPGETVVSDTTILNTTISGLQPYTTYEIKIQAFTVGGSSVGPGGNVTTEESVPDGVRGPSAISRPRELEVSWAEPVHPNGIILLYNLTLEGQLVYSGIDKNFTISNLQVYTEYALQLTACTRIGCAQGPMTRIRTGELPPEGVKTPRVLVRGRTEVEVRWEAPITPNGFVVRYEVLFATSDVLSAYVSKFNATPNTFNTVIRNLTAGTLYYVRVRPFTGGGGTFSNASQVRTHEDVPDDIPAPKVVALSPYALFVIILPPEKPNGIITRYELYQDSISDPVLNETQLANYTASGFTPYSRHTFRVRACTAQGCAYGAEAVAFTKEIAPNGTVTLTASIRNATAVNARWTRVAVPNGRLFYNLMVGGRFIVPGSVDLRTEDRVETGISVEEAEKDFIYNGLLPFSNYTFWVNASNSVGFILSNNVTGSTPEGVPDGLKAPNVTVLTSTSVHVTWQEPALPNGIVLGYGLHQKRGGVETVLFRGIGFSFTVTSLQPFTVYEFRVSANTIAGSGFSEWSQVTTFEDVPSSPDAPAFRDVTSTSLTVKWDPPDPANGVLLYYVIYQNGTEIKRVAGNVTSYVVTGLQPFSVYVFKLSVCTAVGCSNSSDSDPQRTLESGPQGMSAPRLSSPAGRTVIIEWDPPSVPNGIIQKYLIQRRLIAGGNPSVICEVNASLPRRYVDNTAQPVTAYQYRIIAFNSGPGDPSPYSNITTGQGDPEGIPAPYVKALSPYAIYVNWSVPRVPNGVVTHYIIRVVHQQTSRNTTVNANAPFQLNITSLDPYIEYDVIVSACTIGGCGSSSPSQVRTLPANPEKQPAPTAQALSQTSLRMRWDPPDRPNGVIVGYVLFRRTLEDLVTGNISAPSEYVRVFESGALQREYDDTGLGIYSLHQYKVLVATRQGNTTSNSSLPYRTGPAPPLAGPIVNGTALNHTTVLITWYPPEIKKLRGSVVTYVVEMEETSLPGAPVSRVGQFPGNQNRVAVRNLKANTYYTFYVELNNGAGAFKSAGFRIRTLDGMPEGFGPPTLYTASSTVIRVSWNPPTNPNGNVISYMIYVNDTLRMNTSGNARQALVSGLQPYTYYVIKVAVCTTHGCTVSEPRAATTNPAAPTGFAPPRLTAGSTYIEVRWVPPSRPNGIMSGYQIFRRMVYPCPTSPPPKAKCTFIECPLSEQLCGVTCYNPANQMCCNGVLHPRDPTKTCCGTSYLRKNQASDVCCGNAFRIQRAEYQCCYGDYIRVPSGSVCCPTSQGGRVVGQGNACCGDTPYDSGGSRVCVCGALYNPIPPRKCCGGKVVASAQVCCGDESSGAAYDLDSSKSCCGSQYVPKDTSLCCKGSAGGVVVYNYTSAAEKSSSNHTCCGKARVVSSLSCCNERGYDSSYQTCASRSSNGTVGCGLGTICNKTDARVAMCDRCDFDNTTLNCGYVPGYYDPSPATVEPRICATNYEEVLRNQYNPNLRFYNDTNLTPHTLYDYYLVAINNVGNVSSTVAQSRTLMGRPEGLEPPVAVAISSSEVRVTWRRPLTSNGIIQEYRLTRINGQTGQRRVVYAGLNMTFTDRGLEPFTGYRYIIEACTSQCASAEMTSLIYTDQAAPAYVNATILLPVNFSAINVTWVRPSKPNGDIIRYNVSRVVNSTFKIHLNPNDKGLGMSLVIGGLQPYTNYTFEVIACTKVGCTASPLASTLTLQAPPEGVHSPNLTVTGAREIEAKWIEPDILNGVIVKYSLYRGNMLVYNGTDVCYKNSDGKDTCIFQDKGNGLQPVTTYNYSVAATTGGGTTRSGISTATTPESSPEAIPKPRLIARSAYSIFAEWDVPGQPNGNITSYSVVVNGTEYNVGLDRSKQVSGLKPFTVYSVRVKACTAKGCGLGDREYVTTLEAPPIGQGAPTLLAREWDVVQITWSPPSSPNGIITRYEIYRKIGNNAPLQVCITQQLTCLNSRLSGYTVYSYRVRARNSAGFVDGPWRDVRTLEGPPQGINPPLLNVLNSTAIYVSWSAPTQPNGIVTHYEVRYREELQVPDNSNVTVAARVTSNVFNLTVNGLTPHTDYQFLIAAINSRREGTSAWATAKTKQAPPANLRRLQADKAADGKSMRIFWDEPGRPNGVITHYNLYQDGVQIYRGSPREYRVSRLIPYTAYEFQLEACTAAGCTRGSLQVIFSAEVNPQGQAPPMVRFTNATAIQLSWKPPVVPNGIIIRYELHRTVTPVQKRRKRAVVSSSLIYSTNDTNKTDYLYTDTGLKPYTRYSYSVHAVNNGGFTASDPVTVTTSEASPTSMDAPHIRLVDADSLNVSWTKPLEPNGRILRYILFRNNSIPYRGRELSFLDQGLQPYTVYSYTVEACTGAQEGCTMSPLSSLRTAQAAPSGMHPPDLKALSALAITITWRKPDKPNGIITEYQLYEVGKSSRLYAGLGMSFTISNKEPFTKYSFYINACTVAGCTQGPSAEVRTKESAPRGLDAPRATVGGSRFVRVEWSPPLKPNGVILYYLLTRNGTQVYNGTDLRFSDHTVAPFTVYAYVVTAVNSADRLASPPGFSPPTNPGAPDNVSAPTLEVLSATSLKVTWSAPGIPNGVITKYEVLYNFQGSQGNAQIKNAGLSKELTLTGLLPYTQYEVRIRACTKEGCSTGEARSARTFEAPPEGQNPPDFPSLHITARRVLVTWNEPQKPNGFMLLYRLYRRGVSLSGNQPLSYGPEISVANITNGSALAFNDTTVKPYFRYEYRITSANSAGETTSAWSVVQTFSAPPEQVKPPFVNKTHPYSLEVSILPPGIPNGEIRRYILEVSGRNKSVDLDTNVEFSGLEPYTQYVLRVYACTDAGCAGGPTVNWRTSEGVPAQFSAPRPVEINATTIVLEWDEPGKPNGVIQRYEVLYHESCAVSCPTAMPDSGINVQLSRRYVVRDLKPYSMYNFRIRVYNTRHSSMSDIQAVQTQASAPTTRGIKPRVNVTGFRVSVDWSDCFELNGPLDTYELLENGLLIYDGQQTRRDLGTRNVGEYTYVAQATTTFQGHRFTVVAPPSVPVTVQGEVVPATPAPRAASDEWYRSAWFIAVMALVAIIILFILLALCLLRTSGSRTVYVRDREPLPPRTKLRSRPPSMSSLYTSSDRKNGSMIDMQSMQVPYHSSTTALFDSTERLNRAANQYELYHDTSQDWDGFVKPHSKDRDSGLYDDEKYDFSDSEPSTPYQSFKREQYFTDTHL